MTRKRVTASEKKQRHEWAVRQINPGMCLSELTAFTAETWGCSRRQARDVVAKAHKDWLDACYGSEEIDQRDLLFHQVGRLERIARKAEHAGQFSEAVATGGRPKYAYAEKTFCTSPHTSPSSDKVLDPLVSLAKQIETSIGWFGLERQ